MQLIIEKMYLFCPKEQTGKFIEFSPGSNVITSDAVDGNSVGKTTIIKNIYHGLGADCPFSSKWPKKDIIIIIYFSVGSKHYQIYRNDRLFRAFCDEEFLFEAANRKELADHYEKLFGFSVKLPNKKDDSLEIAPPAFLFVLNYLERAKGFSFDSFESLQEYSNVKEEIILSHLGAFDEQYYRWKKDFEAINDLKNNSEEKHNLLSGMIDKIRTEVTDVDYSADLDALRAETEAYSRVYNDLVLDLQKLKTKIIKESNEKIELQHQIESLRQEFSRLQKGIKNANITHQCPVCASHVDDLIVIRSKGHNQEETILLMCDELSLMLDDLNKSIENAQQKYSLKLGELESYKNRLELNKKETTDIITQEGAIRIRDQFVTEADQVYLEVQVYKKKLKDIRAAIKQYDDKKIEINQEYYDNMLATKEHFLLQEITDDNIRTVRNTFKISTGSNSKLAAIIWHINLLRLKALFNPLAIQFPVVIDSPTGDEVDEVKREAIWEYILFHRPSGSQMICSSLGFSGELGESLGVDRIIQINTGKYELLNASDYFQNVGVLEKFSTIYN